MRTLRSYLAGRWHEADGDFQTLVNPSTEAPVARASTRGADFAGAYRHALTVGGPALRELTFAERGELLKALSRALKEHRDELFELSRINNGTTASDGSFDIDGGGGALAYYASVGRGLGAKRLLVEGDGAQLGKSEAFWARHVLAPRQGVAVHVNAFNFPLWGFAEKAATALLAGMPVIVKPATATALVTERALEILIEAKLLPEGALQLVAGQPGGLLDQLGPQDVVAFTGSAATARELRRRPNLVAASTRFNVEADSLNAAVLAPDAAPGTPAFDLFVKDVVREMTQKAGQKCTAVRRILVPADREGAAIEALVARLEKTVVGDPADAAVRMGPLATRAQLVDALDGIAELLATAQLVHGSGGRIDGQGAPEGRGYFVGPTLLRTEYPKEPTPIHHREVFGPVATVLPYSGSAAEAAEIVAMGQGTLVTSVYTEDADWAAAYTLAGGASTGRIYFGSEASAAEAPGSGAAYPQALHGGPGRAGDGGELGGLVGLALYLQRLAVQGDRALVDSVAGR